MYLIKATWDSCSLMKIVDTHTYVKAMVNVVIPWRTVEYHGKLGRHSKNDLHKFIQLYQAKPVLTVP